ncbi:PD-(D/E)XK nuclease family protein [Olsenella sp. An290]|uniref:PD-(D/E)XK nuclease family protein n=1 Tax=Olsenella sp. An290 TaxID=1965625 RepID=UPI000B390396|nr:PD-(D/E)XK nuclease family protein [Olsenella sp. An290]OUO34669.1 hypothetical protein B5F84_05695 [Olsenella sp. An290]
MSLCIVTASDERLVCPEVERALSDALSRTGRAVLLVPSFAQALDAQRSLARAGGMALGVTVSTPEAWASERWEVWGDGRRPVDDASRAVLAARALSRAAAAPGSRLEALPGTAALVADLARAGLPWLAGVPAPEGVTGAERAVVGVLPAYAAELAAHGLVEGCEVMAALPSVLAGAGAEVPAVVLAGFSELPRPARELVCGLARACEVTFVAQPGPAGAPCRAERDLRESAGLAGPAAAAAAPAGAPSRAGELSALLAALFSPVDEPVRATGAVRALFPAGPSAEPELVAREVASRAAAGARDVVVAAPDAAAAWRELSSRLPARGVSLRAELSVPLDALESGRAYLAFVRSVARLSGLAETWPAPEPVPDAPRAGTVRVTLRDMSWWPPRELSDFLVSSVSGLGAARARRLDAEWRANRLLTPGAVLDQLRSEREVSPEVAAATRELLRGRLGSAASRLMAPFVQGASEGAPEAPEVRAVLSCVLAVARSLKELGLTADPDDPRRVPLVELASVALDALARSRATLRLELPVPGASCTARIMTPAAAARLAPASADALLLLGQTSTESAVSAPDDVRSALLAAFGVEGEPHAMEAARARFLALVRVPRDTLVVERLLFGADGRECYPSVMLTELMACYGLAAEAGPAQVADALGGAVASRSETLVRENASARGRAAEREARETPAPAGRIDASERACVSPPPEGVRAEDSRPLLSASQIETYLECPYKWFSLRRLRLRDADAGFTGAEMGTFAHRVLEVTRAELVARASARAEGDAEAAAGGEGPLASPSADWRARAEVLLARAAADPTRRLPGSSVADPGALEEARQVLLEEFEAHLSHQYQLERGRRPLPQALVAHSAQEGGQLSVLRRDLSTLLDFEAGMLRGFEPRLLEWGFGRGGAEVEYAGVRLTGTVDRVDVDAHGQAVVIDYKHKADAGFAGEYDVFPKGGAPASGFELPRRVQSLIYGQVIRRAFPDLTVRAAVYLCTRGAHALAGAVDENVVDNVFGERPPARGRAERLCVPRAATFGRAGESGMEALLDACEEAIASAISRLLAGDIEAAPKDADACLFCPVLNCERRLRK